MIFKELKLNLFLYLNQKNSEIKKGFKIFQEIWIIIYSILIQIFVDLYCWLKDSNPKIELLFILSENKINFILALISSFYLIFAARLTRSLNHKCHSYLRIVLSVQNPIPVNSLRLMHNQTRIQDSYSKISFKSINYGIIIVTDFFY